MMIMMLRVMVMHEIETIIIKSTYLEHSIQKLYNMRGMLLYSYNKNNNSFTTIIIIMQQLTIKDIHIIYHLHDTSHLFNITTYIL